MKVILGRLLASDPDPLRYKAVEREDLGLAQMRAVGEGGGPVEGWRVGARRRTCPSLEPAQAVPVDEEQLGVDDTEWSRYRR